MEQSVREAVPGSVVEVPTVTLDKTSARSDRRSLRLVRAMVVMGRGGGLMTVRVVVSSGRQLSFEWAPGLCWMEAGLGKLCA